MANELSRLSGYYDRKTAHDMDYRGYMEKQAMVKDIGTAIQRSTDQQMIMTSLVGSNITNRLDNVQGSIIQMHTGIQTSIKAQTFALVASQAALAHTFNQGFDRINNTLDMGFAGVSDQLGAMTASFSTGLARVEDAIHKMSDDICKRLDAIHDIVNNPLLTQSRELYRRAVVNNNKGFYEEAMEDIKQAVEKNKTDYISWYLMGKIYAFGAGKFSNVIDLEKAINAYLQAAKYNSPDINESTDARLLAAEIYFYLGITQYSQCNEFLREKKETEAKDMLNKALQSFEESYSYSNKMLEALYNIARCKVLLGKKEDALNDLEKLVLQERNYCIKVYDDGDFSDIEEQFTDLINKLRKNAYIKAKLDYDYVNQLLSELTSHGGTVNEKVPSTFTEDLPYFDILDYSIEFIRMIPIIKEAIRNRKNVLAFEADQEVIRQKILFEIEKYKNLSQDYNLFALSKIFDAIATDEKGIYSPTDEQKEKADELRKMLFNVHASNSHDINNKIGTYKDRAEGFRNFDEIKRELDWAEADMYQPSMAMLMRKGRFDESAWISIVTIGNLPENWKNWYSVLKNDQNLANQLIQAIKEAKERIRNKIKDKSTSVKKRKRIIVAAICIPTSFIFFLLIFVFKSIGLVWGSVITVAIMAEAFAITSESNDIGNKISQILFIPILGGIGGLVVGGVAWILSSFWTFTMILWSIVMLGASAILIFIDDIS